MELPKQLNDEIWNYCRLNSITNIDEFIIKLVKQGFTVEKFGSSPQIKVVDVIKEVPVERIITNDEDVKKLHEALTFEKNKNAELIAKLKNTRDIYGET